MPATFDTSLTIGDTRKLVFPVDDLDTGNFAGLGDIANVQYRLIPALTDDNADAIITKELSDANVKITTVSEIDTVELDELSDTVDVVSVFLEPTETEQLPTQNVQHELQLEDIAGDITTVMQGNVETIPTAISPRQD